MSSSHPPAAGEHSAPENSTALHGVGGALHQVSGALSREASVLFELRMVLQRYLYGLRDGLAAMQVWRVLYQSSSMWRTTRTVFLFNGIWMGIAFVINIFVHNWALELVSGHIDKWFLDLFITVTWMIPMYALSIILSLVWYQDIAQGSCVLLGRQPRTPKGAMDRWKRFLESVGDEIYRLILVLLFLVGAKLLQLIPGFFGIPWLGTAMYSVSCCWTASFYAFEYVWSYIGWTLDERLKFFESRWSYFAGFGTPLTAVTFTLSLFAGAAVYATCFPLLIMLAAAATPRSHVDSFRLRMFFVPGICTTLAFRVCMNTLKTSRRRDS